MDTALAFCLGPRCAVCQQGLASASRDPVCDDCWRQVTFFTPPLCDTCGAPVGATPALAPGAAECPLCVAAPLEGITRAAALGACDGVLRELVHALKYQRRPSLARPLGQLLRARGAAVLDGGDVVTPVPLHPSRQRRRGFNQALLLARALGLPVLPALRRARRTRPQADLDEHARRRNVAGAFTVARHLQLRAWLERPSFVPVPAGPVSRSVPPLEGRCVVLVDDVWTTGATLSACAGVLKAAGAREVRALVIARALPARRP